MGPVRAIAGEFDAGVALARRHAPLTSVAGWIASGEAFAADALFVSGAGRAAWRFAQIVFTRHGVRAEIEALAEIANAAIAARVFARNAAEVIDALIFRAHRLALAQNPIAGAAGIARRIAVSQADILPAVVDALLWRARGAANPARADTARTASRRAGLRLALALLAALARPALLLALLGRCLIAIHAGQCDKANGETDNGPAGAQGLGEVVEAVAVHVDASSLLARLCSTAHRVQLEEVRGRATSGSAADSAHSRRGAPMGKSVDSCRGRSIASRLDTWHHTSRSSPGWSRVRTFRSNKSGFRSSGCHRFRSSGVRCSRSWPVRILADWRIARHSSRMGDYREDRLRCRRTSLCRTRI
jgi:hypothetical protein